MIFTFAMEVRYQTKKLERTLTSDKELKKRYGSLAKKIKQRINQLTSAENLGVIANLPALRLHPHIGKNRGLWSIDIQANWRILFLIGNDPIPILEDGGINKKEVTIITITSIKDPH